MLHRGLPAVALLVLLGWCYQGIGTLHAPQGDFVNHREWGRRINEREFLYANGLNLPYPPFWAAAHAPLALMPLTWAWALHLALGVAALATLTVLCQWLAREQFKLTPWQWLCLHLLVLLLLSRAILRDLQDGGANLILTTLMLGAIVAWIKDRPALAGMMLGCAIALKCTAGLVLLWWLWRRQWRVAGFTVLWAVGFSVSPLLWLGPQPFAEQLKFWITHLCQGLLQRDATQGVLGPEEVRNVALRPTLARLLPSSLALLGLAAVGMLGVCSCRGDLQREDRAAVLREVAVVLLMTLLLSPITWNPHCVAALPALLWLLASGMHARLHPPAWIVLALCAVGLRTPLSPALVGPAVSWHLHVYGAMTASLCGLLVLVAQSSRQKTALR